MLARQPDIALACPRLLQVRQLSPDTGATSYASSSRHVVLKMRLTAVQYCSSALRSPFARIHQLRLLHPASLRATTGRLRQIKQVRRSHRAVWRSCAELPSVSALRVQKPLFTPMLDANYSPAAGCASEPQTLSIHSRLGYSASLTALEVSLFGLKWSACTVAVTDHPQGLCKDVLLQAGVALIISVLPCVAFYLTKAPSHPSLKFALSVALLFAASLTVCRTFLLERKYQVRACCTGLRQTSYDQPDEGHAAWLK